MFRDLAARFSSRHSPCLIRLHIVYLECYKITLVCSHLQALHPSTVVYRILRHRALNTVLIDGLRDITK